MGWGETAPREVEEADRGANHREDSVEEGRMRNCRRECQDFSPLAELLEKEERHAKADLEISLVFGGMVAVAVIVLLIMEVVTWAS